MAQQDGWAGKAEDSIGQRIREGTMLGGIIGFIIGLCCGAALVAINRRMIDDAVMTEKAAAQNAINTLRQETDAVWRERNELAREKEIKEAYDAGRHSPLSDVEKLAETIEKHQAKFILKNNT